MAITGQFTDREDDYVYENAYYRISKVSSAIVDFEVFEKVDNPDKPKISEELKWISRVESSAKVFVWADAVARNNHARSVHWFSFDFQYDLNSQDNIYTQAYNALYKSGIIPEGAANV